MSKFGAGDLKDKITILAFQETDNGLEVITGYSATKTIWAKATYVSDGERFRAGALNQSINIRFIVRKTDIHLNDRISFDGTTYSINGIKPLEANFMEITCGEVI